jgi:hypothetical protein
MLIHVDQPLTSEVEILIHALAPTGVSMIGASVATNAVLLGRTLRVATTGDLSLVQGPPGGVASTMIG